MKKKIMMFILLLFICILILLLGLKTYYLIKYDFKGEINNPILDAKLNKSIEIKTEDVSDYIILNELKIENIFDDYECKQKENQILCINDNKKFKLEHQISYREMFYKALLNYSKDDFYIKKFHKTYKEILENKFKTDYDFILYILNRDLTSSYITKIQDIRFNYYIETVLLNLLPTTLKITKINGDLDGFILSNNHDITVIIEDGMKNYVLTFTNNFDNKLLKSVKLEK